MKVEGIEMEDKDSAHKVFNTLDREFADRRAGDDDFRLVMVVDVFEDFSTVYRILKFVNENVAVFFDVLLDKLRCVLGEEMECLLIFKVEKDGVL